MDENSKKENFTIRCDSLLVERFKRVCKLERRAIGAQFEILVEEWLEKVEPKYNKNPRISKE